MTLVSRARHDVRSRKATGFRRRGGRGRVVRRLAGRELRSSMGRSVLIVALVALPLAFVVIYVSALWWSPEDDSPLMGSASGTMITSEEPGTELPDWVPADTSRSVVILGDQVTIMISGIPIPVRVNALDQTDARLAGIIAIAGTNPTSSEVTLTRALAAQLRVAAGDQLLIEGREYRVSTVIRATLGSRVVVPPGHPLADGAVPKQVLAFGWKPTVEQDTSLHELGWSYQDRSSWAGGTDVTIGLSLTVALSLLCAMFSATLAAAAFAVGARQQRRTLALLACSGASGPILRRMMVTSALRLGVIGSAIGVGSALAAVVAWHRHVQAESPWPAEPFHFPWAFLPVPVAAALAAALVAGWLPARWVTKRDAMRAVSEADAGSGPARLPWVGVALGVVGVGLAALPILRGGRDSLADAGLGTAATDPAPIVAPAVAATAVLFLAALAITGWLLQAAGRRPWRHLSVRLAMRDANRNRGRARSAVAATLAVSTLGGVLITVMSALQATVVRDHYPMLPPGHVSLVATKGPLDPAQRKAAELTLSASLGQPRATWTFTTYGSQEHPVLAMLHDPASLGFIGAPPAAPGDVAAVEFWTGGPVTADVAQALESGVAIVFDPSVVVNGQVTLAWTTKSIESVTRTMPARYVPGVPGSLVPVLIPEATARDLGLPAAEQERVIYDYGRALSRKDQQAADDALGATALAAEVSIETGPENGYGPEYFGWASAAMLLLVAIIVSRLTLLDARTNYATLSQIGASRSTLRRMAATQSWVTTSFGTVLGLLAGWLPAWLVIMSGRNIIVPVLPWNWGLLMVVGVPLLAALIVAWMFTEPERRRA